MFRHRWIKNGEIEIWLKLGFRTPPAVAVDSSGEFEIEFGFVLSWRQRDRFFNLKIHFEIEGTEKLDLKVGRGCLKFVPEGLTEKKEIGLKA